MVVDDLPIEPVFEPVAPKPIPTIEPQPEVIDINIDGIFAVNELYAIIAMKVATKLGIKIPNDLQVIGFTDGVLSKHATPSLTTVNQHGQEMGEKAAELLIEKLEHEDQDEIYQTVVIETELIERNSTK